MKISGSAEIEIRNLSETDYSFIKRALKDLEKNEKSVISRSTTLRKKSAKKFFSKKVNNNLDLVYSIVNGEIEVIEILPKKRGKLFYVEYKTKTGKREKVSSSQI